MFQFRLVFASVALLLAAHVESSVANNRDPYDPYYVHRDYPKLTTPQWVGEEGVEAVVVLAIDDMRDTAKYEAYLRPILERLKEIDGRAPVSIMTCKADPADPQLQTWLKEGLSIECHTIDHPCPLLQGGDIAKAKSTYDRCVDLMNQIPGNKPVAFRMPCCDSLNTPSPRFWAETFNKTTENGNYLQIDTSVFNITTSNDKELPRELVLDPDGKERFRKYLPFKSFVNTIEDYPYPYIIGGTCWEFPCIVPSDWEAQNIQQPNNPKTVEDMKAALDAVVIKQGTFNLVFHPHGWIRSDQIVELIDHAVTKHGKKVKFLTFREAIDRINRNLLLGNPLRNSHGDDGGVRVLDINDDGFLDILIGNEQTQSTRLWKENDKDWHDLPAPFTFASTTKKGRDRRLTRLATFGTLGESGTAVVQFRNTWLFDGGNWSRVDKRLPNAQTVMHDIDHDGTCELITVYTNGMLNEDQQLLVYEWNRRTSSWKPKDAKFPHESSLLLQDSIRFVDVNHDGFDDVIFSNAERYSLHLWDADTKSWSINVIEGTRGEEGGTGPVIPMIVRGDGTNNGAWFHSRSMWVQNEDTNRLPDLVDRLSFDDMLRDYRKQQDEEGDLPEAKSPEASRQCIQVPTGFKIELVASEPLVADPVAFDWAADGSLWVAEMGDYPNGATWNKKGDPLGEPGGRVKHLIDDDGDGKYDRSILFLDKVAFPNGVKAWRSGVLVSAAPEVFYAEDTDGDGVADKRETLYEGFVEGNQQHRVNGFRWGLDNWLYLANGDSGGKIKSIKTGKAIDINGRDLRIRPDTGEVEAVAGRTQFGRNRDDWGNWFGGNNSNPMWHYALDEQYLRRNPHYAAPDGKRHVSDVPGASPIFPVSRTLTRFNDFDKVDRFTSACSPMVYRDELMFDSDQRSAVSSQQEGVAHAFICEPVHNLVHREVMQSTGSTFASRRDESEADSEFLASSDNWFRPTTVRTGPDGGLWIADMYRLVIEHPEWIPTSWQDRLDLRAGHDMGRIYRIVRADSESRSMPQLDKLDIVSLTKSIDSPNGWQRDMVQQMLVQRNDIASIGPLSDLAINAERATTRLHALCTLDGMGAASEALIAHSLKDAHPGVRRHAVRLAEGIINGSSELAAAVHQLVTDDDARVRMQVAYTLGEWNDPSSGIQLAKMVLANRDNRLLAAAALSSIRDDNIAGAFEVALPQAESNIAFVEQLLSIAISIGRTDLMDAAMQSIVGKSPSGFASWQFATATTVLRSLDRRKLDRSKLFSAEVSKRLDELLAEASRIANDSSQSDMHRIACIELLGAAATSTNDLETLAQLLSPQHPPALQVAAAQAMTARSLNATPKMLLANWSSHLPALRAQILDRLLARTEWTRALLTAIEEGDVSSSEVDARLRQQLVTHRDNTIRQQAAKLLVTATTTTRSQVVADYADVAKLSGNISRGKAAFTKQCSACHRLQSVGRHVGPDLTALTDKSPASMLVAILDPNRAVEDKYRDYVALTVDGRQFTGMITSETGSSITLVGADAKEQTILRADLEELRSTGRSLMPEGIEKDLSKQDFADIIAFARSVSAPSKRFPGNVPQVAPVRDDGSIRCFAIHARVYGPSLVFEEKHRNLGWWGSIEDHAIWSLDVPKAGKYRVSIEYACDNSTAGNGWMLSVGQEVLTGVVKGTGTWENYRSATVGEMTLLEGNAELVFRSDGNIKSHLLDLRSIRLLPVGK